MTVSIREIVDILRQDEYWIFFVYIGGNDSMDTVAKLSAYCKEKGEDIKRLLVDQRRLIMTFAE